MTKRTDAQTSTGYPIYTASQRILRFVSLLYLSWYALLAAGSLALVALRLLLGPDALAFLPHLPPSRGVAVATVVIAALDILLNLCFALCAWLASNHPVMARRFRVFAGVLVALSVANIAYDVIFGGAAGLMSSLYSLIITGFLFYLANQIAHEVERGEAVDHSDLACTVKGRRLRTEAQVERALDRGDLEPFLDVKS